MRVVAGRCRTWRAAPQGLNSRRPQRRLRRVEGIKMRIGRLLHNKSTLVATSLAIVSTLILNGAAAEARAPEGAYGVACETNGLAVPEALQEFLNAERP